MLRRCFEVPIRRAALALLFVPAFSFAAQPPLPPDWLATLSVTRPLEVLPRVERLAREFGLPTLDDDVVEQLSAPELALASGALTAGLAAPGGDLQQVYAFAVAPTPPQTLAQLFGGDLAGDIAIFSVAGVEFAARAVGAATLIVPIEQQGVLQQPLDAAPAAARAAGEHDVVARLSTLGLRQLRARVVAQNGHRSFGQRVALNQIGWPPSARWLDAAVGGNSPLAERVTDLFTEASVGVSLSEAGDLSAELTAALAAKAQPGPPAERPRPLLPKTPREPIGVLSGDVSDGALRTLASVWLAYSHGRPDEIEASSYPDEAYAELEAIVLEAAGLVSSIDAALLTRAEDDPFYSNQAVVLGVHDAARFGDLAREATAAWNRLVAASDARVKLQIDVDQRGQLAGVDRPLTIFMADLATALEDPPSAATKEVMQRYYGPSGLYLRRLVELDDHRVLLSDLPGPAVSDLAQAIGEDAGERPLRGRVWIDRYANWQNAILGHYMQDAIGFVPPKTLDEAPVSFTASQDAAVWRVEIKAPLTTVQALSRWLRGGAKKADAAP